MPSRPVTSGRNEFLETLPVDGEGGTPPGSGSPGSRMVGMVRQAQHKCFKCLRLLMVKSECGLIITMVEKESPRGSGDADRLRYQVGTMGASSEK